MQMTTQQRRIYRLPQVRQVTGFGRSHIYQMVRDGKFPKPHKIGIRAVGWDSVEVDRWIAERLA